MTERQKLIQHQYDLWTSPPVKFGLPVLVIIALIANIVAFAQYLNGDAIIEWGLISIGVSMVVGLVAVRKATSNLAKEIALNNQQKT